MDLAEATPAGSRERELGERLVFRALDPVDEQLTVPLLRAAGEAVDPARWALELNPNGTHRTALAISGSRSASSACCSGIC